MLIEICDKYQGNWIHYLPWALLGIRASYNQDLGTSPLEMTIGKHAQLPGTILADPSEVKSHEDVNVQALLRKLQIKDNRVAVPPSLNKPNPTVPTLSESVSHVYARQHNTKGLSPPYEGPFPVTSKPSRSTIEIKVGLNKHGAERIERRHVSDIKVAHLREGATIAERKKRGRPRKSESESLKSAVPDESDSAAGRAPASTEENVNKNITVPGPPNSNYNLRPRKVVATIDFSKPPPGFSAGNSIGISPTSKFIAGPPPKPAFACKLSTWTATPQQLAAINASIVGS